VREEGFEPSFNKLDQLRYPPQWVARF